MGVGFGWVEKKGRAMMKWSGEVGRNVEDEGL
jgi:hypothetical protein